MIAGFSATASGTYSYISMFVGFSPKSDTGCSSAAAAVVAMAAATSVFRRVMVMLMDTRRSKGYQMSMRLVG